MISKFIDYLFLEKNYSKHTINNYRIDLESFQTFLIQNYSCIDFTTTNPKQVRSYIVNLKENNYSEKTISRKISTLRSFYRFLNKINTDFNFSFSSIKVPKIPKKITTIYSEKEMNSLLDQEEYFSQDFKGIRNKTIIELFYTTGIRKTELINIKLSDLDFYNNLLKIFGKRSKQRNIPLAGKIINQIKEYLKERDSINSESEYLFINLQGNNLSNKSVYNLVNNYLSIVTTKNKKSPHVLRHTFASHLIKNGADIATIKELLGHKNLISTQIYTSLDINNLKKVFNQTHPRALKPLEL
ncbi:MAG: tyrosine-type recombinase/integrase [Solirubrobacteraceae bacterium]